MKKAVLVAKHIFLILKFCWVMSCAFAVPVIDIILLPKGIAFLESFHAANPPDDSISRIFGEVFYQYAPLWWLLSGFIIFGILAYQGYKILRGSS